MQQRAPARSGPDRRFAAEPADRIDVRIPRAMRQTIRRAAFEANETLSGWIMEAARQRIEREGL